MLEAQRHWLHTNEWTVRDTELEVYVIRGLTQSDALKYAEKLNNVKSKSIEPRHTGMRYDVVERTTLYSFTSNPFEFDYVVSASFLLKSDAIRFAQSCGTFKLCEFFVIDTVKGEIL